jgi:hypothetical protein
VDEGLKRSGAGGRGLRAPPALVLAAIALLYCWWSWGEGMGQPFGDGPSYLMQAQHYAAGQNADPVYIAASTASRFPPLYPVLLALSGGASSLLLAHLVTTTCLLLGLLVFYAWMRQEQLDPWLAALLTLGVAALPGSWLAALSIQSEYLYLLLSLLALLLMNRYLQQARNEMLLGAALAVGAATLSRTAGVALLPALLPLLWRAPLRTALAALLLALLPPLAWHLVHHPAAGSYADSLGVYAGDVSGKLWRQLATELPALCGGFAANFMRFPALRLPADIIGLLCLLATLRRAAALRPDAIYLLAYLALLLPWPYPEEAPRLLWVALPPLLAQPFLWLAPGLRRPWHRLAPGPLAAVGAALLLAMSVPGLVLAFGRYRAAASSDVPQSESYLAWYGVDPVAAQEETTMHLTFVNAMRALPEYVPAGDCVLTIRPELVSYYGHREGRYPPLNSVPDPRFGAALRQLGCRYALGVSGKDRRYPLALYPLPRLGNDTTALFKSTLYSPSSRMDVLVAMLVRLEPRP